MTILSTLVTTILFALPIIWIIYLIYSELKKYNKGICKASNKEWIFLYYAPEGFYIYSDFNGNHLEISFITKWFIKK